MNFLVEFFHYPFQIERAYENYACLFEEALAPNASKRIYPTIVDSSSQ